MSKGGAGIDRGRESRCTTCGEDLRVSGGMRMGETLYCRVHAEQHQQEFLPLAPLPAPAPASLHSLLA